MKRIWAAIMVMIVLGPSCTKQESREPKRWTSSISMEATDQSAPEGRIALTNALGALSRAISEQEEKIQHMRRAGETNAAVSAELDKQEKILGAMRKRERYLVETLNMPH